MGKKSFKQEMSELRFAGLGVVLIVVATAVFIFSGFLENPLDLSRPYTKPASRQAGLAWGTCPSSHEVARWFPEAACEAAGPPQ